MIEVYEAAAGTGLTPPAMPRFREWGSQVRGFRCSGV